MKSNNHLFIFALVGTKRRINDPRLGRPGHDHLDRMMSLEKIKHLANSLLWTGDISSLSMDGYIIHLSFWQIGELRGYFQQLT